MPELNLGPPPSRSPLPAVLISIAVLGAVAAAVFFLNPRKTAEVSVTKTQIYAARTETQAVKGGMHIIGAPARIDQDLYVLVTVKMTDKLRLPLFIKDETAVLTAPDNTILETSAVQKADLENVYLAFPQVKALATTPLARDTQIAPGQTMEGMVLLHFPGASEDNWKSRKSATLTIELFHQDPQVLTIP